MKRLARRSKEGSKKKKQPIEWRVKSELSDRKLPSLTFLADDNHERFLCWLARNTASQSMAENFAHRVKELFVSEEASMLDTQKLQLCCSTGSCLAPASNVGSLLPESRQPIKQAVLVDQSRLQRNKQELEWAWQADQNL